MIMPIDVDTITTNPITLRKVKKNFLFFFISYMCNVFLSSLPISDGFLVTFIPESSRTSSFA